MKIFWDKIPECFTHAERKSPGFVIVYMEHPDLYDGPEFSGFEDHRYLIESVEYELEAADMSKNNEHLFEGKQVTVEKRPDFVEKNFPVKTERKVAMIINWDKLPKNIVGVTVMGDPDHRKLWLFEKTVLYTEMTFEAFEGDFSSCVDTTEIIKDRGFNYIYWRPEKNYVAKGEYL